MNQSLHLYEGGHIARRLEVCCPVVGGFVYVESA